MNDEICGMDYSYWHPFTICCRQAVFCLFASITRGKYEALTAPSVVFLKKVFNVHNWLAFAGILFG